MDALQGTILNFLDKLGLDISVFRLTNSNIMIRCPFAEKSHIDGTDNKPSFGLRIGSGGFLYNCFTGGCDHRGHSIVEFVEELISEKVINVPSDEVLHIQNSMNFEFPDYEETFQEVVRKESQLSLEKDRGINERFIKYNYKRGVTAITLEELRIQFNEESGIANFPLFDRDQSLVGFVDHKISGGHPKYVNRDFDKRNHLFLEHLITDGTIGIIVEGVYDAVLSYQHLGDLGLLDTYSVVGTLGTKIPQQQIGKIVEYFDRVILMADNDIAGIDLENRIWRGLHKRMPLIYKVRYNESDPGAIKSFRKFEEYLRNRTYYKKVC